MKKIAMMITGILAVAILYAGMPIWTEQSAFTQSPPAFDIPPVQADAPEITVEAERPDAQAAMSTEIKVIPRTYSGGASQGQALYNMTDNEKAELRKQIESGGNYSTYTGNGYVGAYQFSERLLQGRLEYIGVYDMGTQEFLASPETQDALADWYANDRYGGWSGVPTSGGW